MCRIFKMIFIIMLTITFLLACSNNQEKSMYDNATNMYKLITKRYSSEEIMLLEYKFNTNLIDFETFVKIYDVECLRKTSEGNYAILLYEDGRKAFIFCYKNTNWICFHTLDRFQSKKDFEDLIYIGMDESILNSYATAVLPSTYNIVDINFYYVKEGAFAVEFKRPKVGTNDPYTVSKVTFYDDEMIKKSTDIPYILPIDRISQ